MLCIGGSLMFCAFGSAQLYKDWQNSPVVTTIDTTSEKIENIPFPAFTICNMNKADKKRVLQLGGKR